MNGVKTLESFQKPSKSKEEDDRSKRPVLSNNKQGVAAWLETDKNGNAYISLKLPLGLEYVNVFPSDEDTREAFNKLSGYLKEEGRV